MCLTTSVCKVCLFVSKHPLFVLIIKITCRSVFLVYFAFFLTNLLSFENFFVRDVKFIKSTNKSSLYTEFNISIRSISKTFNTQSKWLQKPPAGSVAKGFGAVERGYRWPFLPAIDRTRQQLFGWHQPHLPLD